MLGAGAYSVTYEAIDHELGRHVAIKMERNDKPRSILVNEFDFLKRIKGSPGVIQV